MSDVMVGERKMTARRFWSSPDSDRGSSLSWSHIDTLT